jgi:hypothetical protein
MKPPQAEHARSTKRERVLGVASACLLPVIAAGCGGVAAHKRASSPPIVFGPSFAAPVGYATGSGPGAVAIADLNGDGKGDLVTANSGGGTISVLINRRNKFDRRQDYRVPRPPASDAPTHSVAIADLNADGKPDIASVGGRHTVSVLHNRGDGTFQPARDYESGPSPQAVAAGDLNGDGRPDLAVADGSCCVSILLNTGAGFAKRTKYWAARVGDNPMSLAIADLNGDGSADLATASGEGNSSLLFNRGDGTFRRGRNYDAEMGPSWVVAADFDGNGTADLGVASNDLYSDEFEDEEGGVALQPAWVYVFANRGQGRLSASHTFLGTFGYAEGIDALVVGDLNRDGKPDLLVARSDSNYENGFLSLLPNSGDGSFPERLDYRLGPEGDSIGDIALAVGDLNGDARLDIVSADASTHTVTVLLSAPELCDVPDVSGAVVSIRAGFLGRKLPAAKRALKAAHCGMGTIRYVQDPEVAKDGVISQKPKFGAVLPGGGKVNLVVSKGRK